MCTPPATQPQPSEHPPPQQDQPQPVPLSSTLIQQNLTDFWENFQPDLPDIDEPPVPLADLWAQIRLRTTPWATDVLVDYPPPTPSGSIGDIGSEGDRPPSSTSSIMTPFSVASQPGSISGASHQAIAGQVHLLAPQVHRVGLDAEICNPGADIPPPLRLRGWDADWYERTLRYGVRLPRPAGAPTVRPGVLMLL